MVDLVDVVVIDVEAVVALIEIVVWFPEVLYDGNKNNSTLADKSPSVCFNMLTVAVSFDRNDIGDNIGNADKVDNVVDVLV